MATAEHPLVEAALKETPSVRDELLRALINDYLGRGGELPALSWRSDPSLIGSMPFLMPAFDNAPVSAHNYSPDELAELERLASEPGVSIDEFLRFADEADARKTTSAEAE